MNRFAAIFIAAFFPLLVIAQTQSKNTETNPTGPKSSQTSVTESPQTPKIPTNQTGKAQPTFSEPPSVATPNKFFGLNYLEVVVILILLIMAVPDVCRRVRRPALAYSVFVLFGIVLGNLIPDENVKSMLVEAGRLGFLLLLFEVGLEIQLPEFREFLAPLKKAVRWKIWQYPLIMFFTGGVFVYCIWGKGIFDWTTLTNAGWEQHVQWIAVTILAASALTGCSVGMAHAAWHAYPCLGDKQKQFILHTMVALEMISILMLSVTKEIYKAGLTSKVSVILGGMVLVVCLVTSAAKPITQLFQYIIDKATHWRVHWIILLVLAVSAVGERLGLSGEKTAFVLGLCMGRTRTDGIDLEHYIAPISQRLLIPIFFIALGMQMKWRLLFSELAIFALIAACLLMALRARIHRHNLDDDDEAKTFLLQSPNLTLVALAAAALLSGAKGNSTILGHVAHQLATWLVLTGLFITISAIFRLPPENETGNAQT